MAFTVTSRGYTEAEFSAGGTVGNTFTPAEGDLVIVFVDHSGAGSYSASGFSATWTDHGTFGGDEKIQVFSATIGASPSSGQVSVSTGSGTYSAGVIQISGSTGDPSIVQLAGSSAYQSSGVTSYALPTLSAFGSASNMALTLCGAGANGTWTAATGYTEIGQSSSTTTSKNAGAFYKASEDTTQTVEGGFFAYNFIAGVAIEVEEASGGGGVSANATLEAISVSASNPAVNVSVEASATVEAISVTAFNPSVNIETSANATLATISISKNNPSVNIATNANATNEAVTVTAFNPAVSIGANVEANATLGTLTLASYNPSVNISVKSTATLETITVTANNPSVELGTATNANATLEALTLVSYNPSVKIDLSASATKADLTLASYNPSIVFGEIQYETFGIQSAITGTHGTTSTIKDSFGVISIITDE